MVKEVFFFTEMGYTAYSQDVAAKFGYTNLMFPNENFSPEKASELYSMYFEELQHCTEAGFDGVMINEHHNNPLSLMPSVNVIGAVLAKLTQKGKIVFLGNVLPIHENPVRVAEEVAMIDVISGAGWSAGSCAASDKRAWPPIPILYSTGSGLRKPTTSSLKRGPPQDLFDGRVNTIIFA
jgi:hypothetical protein